MLGALSHHRTCRGDVVLDQAQVAAHPKRLRPAGARSVLQMEPPVEPPPSLSEESAWRSTGTRVRRRAVVRSRRRVRRRERCFRPTRRARRRADRAFRLRHTYVVCWRRTTPTLGHRPTGRSPDRAVPVYLRTPRATCSRTDCATAQRPMSVAFTACLHVPGSARDHSVSCSPAVSSAGVELLDTYCGPRYYLLKVNNVSF